MSWIVLGQYNLRQVQPVSITKYNFAHDTLDKETRLTKWLIKYAMYIRYVKIVLMS